MSGHKSRRVWKRSILMRLGQRGEYQWPPHRRAPDFITHMVAWNLRVIRALRIRMNSWRLPKSTSLSPRDFYRTIWVGPESRKTWERLPRSKARSKGSSRGTLRRANQTPPTTWHPGQPLVKASLSTTSSKARLRKMGQSKESLNRAPVLFQKCMQMRVAVIIATKTVIEWSSLAILEDVQGAVIR